MFLVCVSMMLNGDTLQLAGTVEELNCSLSLLFAFQWQKRTCFLTNHSYTFTRNEKGMSALYALFL